MENDLKKKLEEIYLNIKQNTHSISLLAGDPGIALFKFYYLKHVKYGNIEEIVSEIEVLSEASINYNNISTFCNGQAGINWFFNLLYRNLYIDKDDYNIITSSDNMLVEASLNYLSNDVYDFLHGGVGIAHYLLHTRKKSLKPYFNNFLTSLIKIMGPSGSVAKHFDFDEKKLKSTQINPSLSHGLASILKFSLECNALGIYKRKTKYIAKSIIDFLSNNLKEDKTYSYFPYTYDLNSNNKINSRLSWCYGDLGIAFIMLQYGKLFHDKKIEALSLEILIHASKRRSHNETGIVDAGLCHGAAGVAYIFSRLWHNTKKSEFHEASNFWFGEMLKHSKYSDGVAGYKRYNHLENNMVNDCSLLEGVAGIGLAIISHLYEDYSWDSCLMLNDLKWLK